MKRIEEEEAKSKEERMTTRSSCSSNGLLPSSASPRKTDDLEVGQPIKEFELDDDDDDDPFDIAHTKNAPLEILRRWRQAALVLNASRRFRYTLDLKKEEEREQRRRMVRSHAQVIRAALLFRLAGEQQIVLGTSATPPTVTGDYAIGLEELASMTRDHNIFSLHQCGGVKGLSNMLKTNLATGIVGDENDLIKRMNTFGTNRYPQKKGRGFLRFLWEAWQDLTLIILIVAAIASLGLGIKTEGLSHGWYDGASISFAVMLVIIVTGVKFILLSI